MDKLIEKNLKSLQEKIMHQDVAIDELTAESLRQKEKINYLINYIKDLEKRFNDLRNKSTEKSDFFEKPPHY